MTHFTLLYELGLVLHYSELHWALQGTEWDQKKWRVNQENCQLVNVINVRQTKDRTNNIDFCFSQVLENTNTMIE